MSCKYCENLCYGNRDLGEAGLLEYHYTHPSVKKFYDSLYLSVCHNDNEWYLAQDDDEIGMIELEQISYCPWCGRKLEWKEEKC